MEKIQAFPIKNIIDLIRNTIKAGRLQLILLHNYIIDKLINTSPLTQIHVHLMDRMFYTFQNAKLVSGGHLCLNLNFSPKRTSNPLLTAIIHIFHA